MPKRLLLCSVLITMCAIETTWAADWPQLQKDAARTGRTSDVCPPPFRARWIWLGPNKTLRNKYSNAAWPDDLKGRSGYNYPMPTSVPMTLADMVQPVAYRGMVYVGSMEGKAYGINASDGSTAWEASLPGGTIATAAAVGNVVVFNSVTGGVYAYNYLTGQQVWKVSTPKAIVSAPCVMNDVVYSACQDGCVYAIQASTGQLLWRSQRMGGAIQGSLAATADAVYVGAEDMNFYKLDARTGAISAKHPLYGQSFRLLWPVIYNGKVWVSTVTTECVGSEYVNDAVFNSSATFAEEEANMERWLNGDTNGGAWANAAVGDWRHYFALDQKDLTEPFMILSGPSDGCGQPPDPPVVDNSNRVINWWPTKFPTVTKLGNTFGTKYSIDLAGVNQTTGHRVLIDNHKLAGVWPIETDNLYGLSVGGTYAYMRQNFRGTYAINLANTTHYQIQVQVRNRDGGNWNAPIMYVDTDSSLLPDTPSRNTQGRVGVSIADNRLYFTENYCITAVETGPQ